MSRKAALESVKSGHGDFSLVKKLRQSKHANQRCKERNVTAEDALSQKPQIAIPIIKGKTVVTVLNRNTQQPAQPRWAQNVSDQGEMHF
jgi:hypothetical protein